MSWSSSTFPLSAPQWRPQWVSTSLLGFAIIASMLAGTGHFADAGETRRPVRKVSDDILKEPEVALATDLSPINDSSLTEADLRPWNQPLELDGPRGKETAAGPRHGRYCDNGLDRAGLPYCVGRYAKPSRDGDHQVGYVGGGTLFWGSGRRSDEGTIAMDYAGHLFQRKTWLRWSHGVRYQGGEGRYQTDGPRLLPEK